MPIFFSLKQRNRCSQEKGRKFFSDDGAFVCQDSRHEAGN